MRFLRHLQHWLGGTDPSLDVAEFVPDSHPIRLWADTFPWSEMVEALEQSVARRFPKKSAAGRPSVSIRVLLALELLKQELTCSDEAICHHLRTDFAVMYACGYSRPVVESHTATLESRGAGHLRYRGPHGARVQLGMTVMAHNGSALVRLRGRLLSSRAQTFRQKLRLRNPKTNKINRLIS